ncbi:MAG: type IV pilus assembly protein PilM [Candidatus Moranbacteria bacterium]|nr:type IV pilus assembly protein PilM [Candidatus Moranbacteria bacterium]
MFEKFKVVMKKNIIQWSHPPFGLDLSDLSVKMIQLDRVGKNYSIESFSKVALSSGSIVSGEIQNSENVIRAIRDAYARGFPKKPNTKKVICSIPETKAFLRIIDMPKMSEEELKEAIHWEVEENIPLAVDQVYYDYQILKEKIGREGENRCSVFIVAVSKKIVHSFIDVVEQAGFEIMGVEIESLSQARCLLSEEEALEKSTLIFDMGDMRSSFLFSVGNTITFTSSTHISSQMITDAYASRFNITRQKAEKIKFEQGIGSPVMKDPFFLAVESLLENLYQQIKYSIDFVIQAGHTDHIDEILLCGGGANTKKLPLYLSRRIGVPVYVGDPWKNVFFEKKVPIIPKEEAIQYSTAIGLALHALSLTYEDIS